MWNNDKCKRKKNKNIQKVEEGTKREKITFSFAESIM